LGHVPCRTCRQGELHSRENLSGRYNLKAKETSQRNCVLKGPNFSVLRCKPHSNLSTIYFELRGSIRNVSNLTGPLVPFRTESPGCPANLELSVALGHMASVIASFRKHGMQPKTELPVVICAKRFRFVRHRMRVRRGVRANQPNEEQRTIVQGSVQVNMLARFFAPLEFGFFHEKIMRGVPAGDFHAVAGDDRQTDRREHALLLAEDVQMGGQRKMLGGTENKEFIF
jgi:hypothetical protein